MLEYLFGSQSVEKILFYLLVNENCYASELQRQLGGALSPIQKGLGRLEKGGIIVSTLKGRTRIYQFNPRYPFLQELKQFLNKSYRFLPQDIKKQSYEPSIRERPRKKGKCFRTMERVITVDSSSS